jgi:hypothetical protein
VLDVTAAERLAHSAQARFFQRLAAGLSEWFDSAETAKGFLMKTTFYDDVATALVSVCFCVVCVSMVVAVFSGVA